MIIKKKIFFIITFVLSLVAFPACASTKKMSVKESIAARQKLIDYSKKFLGCSYSSGGIGPKSFDCSGFVFSMSRESIGLQLPRSSPAIYSFTDKITDTELEAGDLVFFKTTSSGKISHVGIYLGNKEFIHSASDGPETGIIISTLTKGYWKNHYVGAGRILPKTNTKVTSAK